MRTQLSNEDLYRLLWDLPKGGDIHNHHEFSVPMRFWIDRAVERPYFVRARLSACGEEESFQWQTLRQDSIGKLPPCAQADFKSARSLSETERREWLAALTLDPSESKDEFFERAVRRLGDMERDAVLYADALVVAQTQLEAENAIYLETQADPRSFAGMTEDEGAAVLRLRLRQPDSLATGVAVRMQVSTVRFLPGAEDDVRGGFAFVHRNRDLWAATNLVGREDDPQGRPARFAGLLRGGKHLVEVSLISSQSLGYVPDLRRHPFPLYLRQAIPVCLNTDDRGIMDSNLTDEYFAAVSLFDLSWAEAARIGRWSLEFSFAEPALKKELLARFERNLAAFERKYSGGDWRERVAQVQAQHSGYTPRLMKLRAR